MPSAARTSHTSSPLPPYHAVLAVDAERYTHNAAYHQQVLSTTIPEVLADAFDRSGIPDVWRQRRFPQSTGDGYVIGVAPENLPLLVHPLLGELHNALQDTQPRLAAYHRELRLRLRVSIDVGPLPDSQHQQPLDGIGRAMNETHRLLNSPPVREELRLSDPEVTHLAAIVSRRVFDEAVFDGFTGLNARRFRRVDVHLPEKEFAREAYVHVPVLSPCATEADSAEEASRDRDGSGSEHPPESEGSSSPERAEPPAANRMGDNYGQLVQGSPIQGGLHGNFGAFRNG